MAEQIIALRMTIDGKEVVATFQDVSVKLRNLGTEAERGGQKTSASVDRAAKSVSALSSQLDKARVNSERTFSSTRAGLESISKQLATMRNLVGAWIGATQITQVVQGIARMAGRSDQQRGGRGRAGD